MHLAVESNAASGLSSLTTGAALPVDGGSNHLTQALELAGPVYIAEGSAAAATTVRASAQAAAAMSGRRSIHAVTRVPW
jgi:hypothetical protein